MNEVSRKILEQVNSVIIGKEAVTEKVLMAVLAQGHVLLEDVPGVGKTTMALAFARTLGLDSRRVQFTSDTMPSDIIGFSLYNKETGRFDYKSGAVMTNLLLADEINRTSSKTQSALLEAMEEYQVTVDGHTYPLPKPFVVLATQNPVGSAGTQLLPSSQLDRFMIRTTMGYPDRQSQVDILRERHHENPLDRLQVRPRQKAKNTWLAGKIKCGVCGYALVDKHYPASGSRYLQCSGKMNSGDCKGGGTIYTDEIEGIIGDEIRQKLTQLGTLVKCKVKSIDSDLPEQNAQLAQVEREIAALLERLPEADGVLLRYIKQRIEELDGKKRELTERISRHQRREEDGTEIGDPSALWGMLDFDDKRQVVEHLIRVIRVTGDHVRIEWRI